MRALTVAATVIALGLIPAAAQRVGGSSGHSAAPSGGFHGGVSGHAPVAGAPVRSGPHYGSAPNGGSTFRFGSAPRFGPSAAPPGDMRRFAPAQPVAPFRLGSTRPPYTGIGSDPQHPRGRGGPVPSPFVDDRRHGHHHRDGDWDDFFPGFYSNGVYLVGSYPWINPAWAYNWDSPYYNGGYSDEGPYGYDSNGVSPYPYTPYANDPPAAPVQYEDAAPSATHEPAPSEHKRAPYRPESQASTAEPELPQAPVTIIFKDGRAPEHVRNYLLTSTTLTILDSGYHSIPLEQVDLVATKQANESAGIEFLVPKGSL